MPSNVNVLSAAPSLTGTFIGMFEPTFTSAELRSDVARECAVLVAPESKEAMFSGWRACGSEGDKEKDGDPQASAEVVRCLEQYGSTRPHLYPLVLRFLSSTPDLLSRHTEDISKILDHIDQEKILPPLGVMKILSRNNVASVGLVKQWLMSRIKEAREEINMDQQLIESYRTETRTKLKQVQDLSDPDHPRVFHVTTCAACGGQLDLPSVHFMCNHSYHQR